ncbi:hypothetical protein REPUB_Repub08aG0108400 [Reevesia pubescens]
MAEELNDLWAKLALTDKEQFVVTIKKSWVVDMLEKSKHCLVGKLMTRKAVNMEALKQFCQKFGRSRIHGLPIGLMNEKVGIVIGESLGDVEEVEKKIETTAWGKFVRVRVRLNVHKPLQMVGRISLDRGNDLFVSFRFEKLPDFCYVCGHLDHQESECDIAFNMNKMVGGVSREYGAWLRAESPYFLPQKFESPILGYNSYIGVSSSGGSMAHQHIDKGRRSVAREKGLISRREDHVESNFSRLRYANRKDRGVEGGQKIGLNIED